MKAKYKLELSKTCSGEIHIENQTYARGWGEWRNGYYETWQIFHETAYIDIIVFSIDGRFTYQECKYIAGKFLRGDYKFRHVNLATGEVFENHGIDDKRDD